MIKVMGVGMGLALVSGVLWGEAALAATAVFVVSTALLWGYTRAAYVRIPELHVGVLYNRQKKAFSRFLPAGGYWLVPFAEEVAGLIDLTVDTAADTCRHVQTSSGIPVDIEWTLSFTLNPFRIAADKRPKLAHALPRKAAIIPRKHVNNCLRHLVGDMTIESIWEPGAQRRLERDLRQLAGERLAAAGFELSRIMIGAIDIPAPVKQTLEAAQRRRLQADNEAQALARLQQAVSQFSEQDMARLLELERIHALGQNGVSLLYPLAGHTPRPAMPDPALWPPHRVTIDQYS